MPTSRFRVDHAIAGGGVFRPFEEGDESWAELVLRTSRAIMDITHWPRNRSIGHSTWRLRRLPSPSGSPMAIPPVGRSLAGPCAVSTTLAVVDARFVPMISASSGANVLICLDEGVRQGFLPEADQRLMMDADTVDGVFARLNGAGFLMSSPGAAAAPVR